MSNTAQWRPYLAYLERLADRRESAGEKVPAAFDDAYWRQWRAEHAVPRRRDRTAQTELRKDYDK
jgi:hypothetical protein